MQYRELGNSGIRVTAITFGAWAIGGWMWGGTDRKKAMAAIHKSLELGITTFDTAAVYGQGLSEEIIGEALSGRRDRVQILTKYGLRWDTEKGDFFFNSVDNNGNPIKLRKYGGKQSVIRECEESLRRLKTDYIDLYQHHKPDSTTPIEETMEAMEILLQQGKIRAAGVSSYSVEQCERAAACVPLCCNQVPYSMLNRDIENELVPWAREKNVAILAFSPLQRGILTGKIPVGHKFPEGDHRQNQPHYKAPNHQRIMDFLDSIRPVAETRGLSLAQLAINWTMDRPGITAALVGARNVEQAEENARAANVSLTQEDLEKINSALDQLDLET